MKNVAVLCVIMMLASITALSQVNCNPDPNGPQWLAGGIPDSISSEQQQIIDSIPEMILDPLNYSITLPTSIHNHEKKYMPDIMYQGSQYMCSQASIVYYVFTYEINRLRDGDAEISSNRFHPSFTYNFLNGGTGSGLTHITSGIEILKEMGCPDEDTYNTAVGYVGVPTLDPTEWMSGYGNYRKSLVNRVTQEEKIDISTSLTDLKYWLYNHGDPESNDNGGIGSVVFENMYGVQWSAFDPNDPYSKLYISGVIETDTNDAHVMTIVGYDDALQCGNYTGALILANSWGEY